MKKNLKLFFGFVIIAMAIFTLGGCDLFGKPEFPPEFIGTWKREESSIYTSTRIFTTETLKISSQSNHRILEDINGDTYTMSHSDDRNYKITKTIRYVDGKLVISGCQGSYLSNNNWCNGTWIRQ